MKKQLLRGVTILYILLPSFLFIFKWLKLPYAIIGLIILASFTVPVCIDVFRAARYIFHQVKTRQILHSDLVPGIVLAILLIVAWLAFSGAGGIGYQNDDYRASNALLHDLIAQDWPLKAVIDGAQVPIVYYLAYYLPSAVVGKAFGWISANIFMFVWTLIGVLLAFAWFWNLSRIDLKNRAVKLGILITEIFCLAGGLDYIGWYVLGGSLFDPSAHIEQWARYFQYSSNTTLMYWVPQHTIATWLVIGLIADVLYHKQNLKHLGMVVMAGVIWSPFGIVGTIPYLLIVLCVYLLPHNRRYLFNWESVVFNALSIGIGAIYLLYLGSNQFRFPIGFTWQFARNHVDLTINLLKFWFLEFAFLGFLTLLLIAIGVFYFHSTAFSTHNFRKWHVLLEQEFAITPIQIYLFLVSLCVLGVLPLFMVGLKNDLVMRGSIASLFIFWAFIAKVIADVSIRVRTKFKLLYTLISIVLIMGFLTSFNEIERSVIMYHLGPPALSNSLTTLNVNNADTVLQRVGREDSIFYRYFGN